MKPRILLVNPPIYDFAAYDFWLKPYGMLSIAGYLRHKADFKLFDYLDRMNPFMTSRKALTSDKWGRGRFYFEKAGKGCTAEALKWCMQAARQERIGHMVMATSTG